MLTMTSLNGKHITKGWLTFSSPLNDEWLKKCICFCIRGTVNSQKFFLLAFFSCLLVNCLVGGGGGRGVGELGIIISFSINKEFVDRLDGKLPFLITEIWGEIIHTNVWYRCQMLGVKYPSILFGMSFAHYALRLLQKYQHS